ncbi:unnamed protein product [Parajaminaea phylloscopi]
MKLTHTLLLVVLLAVTVQVIDAKKCKAKHSKHASSHKTNTNNAKSNKGTNKSTSSASSSSGSSKSSGKVSVSGMVPNGKKAGVAGGQSVKFLGGEIGAWLDWGASGGNDHSDSSAMYVPMLWGMGNDDANTGLSSQPNSKRLADFKKLEVGKYKYIIGFNEMDFHGTGSSGAMNVDSAASMWDSLMKKHQDAGTKLISPSMAKQKDENMLRPFLNKVSVKPDCIGIHIFQDSIEGVKGVLNYYTSKYSDYDCFWITEFAYANYQSGSHNYGNVGQTDSLAKQAVSLFESNDKVKAYFISDADNGENGMLTPNHSGSALTSLGQTYKAAISSVSKRSNHAHRHVRRAAAASRRSATP